MCGGGGTEATSRQRRHSFKSSSVSEGGSKRKIQQIGGGGSGSGWCERHLALEVASSFTASFTFAKIKKLGPSIDLSYRCFSRVELGVEML